MVIFWHYWLLLLRFDILLRLLIPYKRFTYLKVTIVTVSRNLDQFFKGALLRGVIIRLSVLMLMGKVLFKSRWFIRINVIPILEQLLFPHVKCELLTEFVKKIQLAKKYFKAFVWIIFYFYFLMNYIKRITFFVLLFNRNYIM